MTLSNASHNFEVEYSFSNNNITSQRTLFPIDQHWNKIAVEADCKNNSMQFKIKNDLLKSWIGWVNYAENDKKIHGFRYAKYSCGYIMLCTFVRHILGINRYPFCEDRIIALAHQYPEISHELKFCMDYIDKEKFQEIIEELSALYSHTQKMLSSKGLEKVTLTRKISWAPSSFRSDTNYGQILYQTVRAAKVLGMDKISVDMDMLNSFGDDSGYSHMPITLTLDIPVRDVLYCSNLIAPFTSNEEKGDVESGEWVIINRSLSGVVKIPLSAISIDDSLLSASFDLSKNDALKYFESYSPVYMRCAQNRRLGSYTGIAYKPTMLQRIRLALHCIFSRDIIL